MKPISFFSYWVQEFVVLFLVHAACCTVPLNPSTGTSAPIQDERLVHSLSGASIAVLPSVKDDELEQGLPTSPAMNDQWSLPGNRSLTSGSVSVSAATTSAVAPINYESQLTTSLIKPGKTVTQPVTVSPATSVVPQLFRSDRSSDDIVFSTSISADFTLSINVSGPSSVLSSCSRLRISLYQDEYFRPLSTSPIQFPFFPADAYCLQLQCGCVAEACRYLPTPPPQHYGCQTRALPGLNMAEWNVSVVGVPLGDVGQLGGLQLQVEQHGRVRFPRLNLYHNCSVSGNMTQAWLAADEQLECRLRHGAVVFVEVYPDTWFCENLASSICRSFYDWLPPLPPDAPSPSVQFKPALRAPVEAIVACMTAVAVVLVVVVSLCFRRTRRLQCYDNELAQVFNAGENGITMDTGSHGSRIAIDDALPDSSPPGGRGRVLLVHSAATAAETAAVESLVAALRSRGVSVVDQTSPSCLSADAPLPSADDRVLVLSCPSAAAALAGARCTPRQRRFVSAVQHLAASASGARYGRVLVAQLGEGAPLLEPLTPGVRYTLPQHAPQLVRAVLGGATTAT